MAKKRSVIWVTPHSELQEMLNESSSIVEVLKKMGFNGYNGNHRTLTARIKQDGFDLTKFKDNKVKSKRKQTEQANKKNLIPNEEVFIQSSKFFSNTSIKKRLLKLGWDYCCLECGITEIYNNKPISLQLDHKNGVSNDHRLENLRFLCPNCHSQTETFSGKNSRRSGIQKTPQRTISKKPRQTKIKWPNKVFFEKEVWLKPVTKIAKSLGVSDVAVSKYIKKLGVSKPPTGYWLKKK